MNGRWPGIGIPRQAAPIGDPWTPADEPTVTRWFDESLASSITLDAGGTKVAEWRSRVGSDILSQSNETQMPLRLGAGLHFEAGDFLLPSPSLVSSAFFMVLAPLPSSEAWVNILSLGTDFFSANVVGGVSVYFTQNSAISSYREYGSVYPLGWPVGAGNPRTPVGGPITPITLMAQYTANGSISSFCGRGTQAAFQVITCSGSPSEALVQKLEGWAAHKYGVNVNLPANHPYKNAPPIRVPWTPADLGSQLIAYFDPSNASSLTLASGDRVSEMRSSFGRTPALAQGLSSEQASVVSGVLRVDTPDRFWNMPMSSTQDVRQFFVVANRGVYFAPIASDQPTAVMLADPSIYMPMDGRGPARFFNWFGVSNMDGGLGQIMIDGRLVWEEWDNHRSSDIFLSTPRLLGARSTVASPVRGMGSPSNSLTLRGIAMLSSWLSATDTEKLTGFMAHHHGVADQLPANHPYKNAPPLKS